MNADLQELERLRQPFLIEPGEGFLLSPDLFGFADRFADFKDATGLEDHQIVASPIISMPMPSPDARTETGSRWPHVNAEALWLPLFWLPASVADRALVGDESGGEHLETDEEYLNRVMSQCALSGLFDVETGTWLNVFEYAGIDASSAGFIERVRVWQQGGEDPELDSVDIAPMFEGVGTESLAVAEAVSSVPDSIRAQWALTADYVGQSVRDMQSSDEPLDHDERVSILGTFIVLAFTGFAGGELIDDIQTRQVVGQMSVAIQDPDADLDSVARQLLTVCAQHFLQFNPVLERLATEAAEAETAYAESQRM